MSPGGFILDGFPRNLAQADALDALLGELGQPLDAVVQMDVEYGELMRRISGRRSCADCGRVFNRLHLARRADRERQVPEDRRAAQVVSAAGRQRGDGCAAAAGVRGEDASR